MSNRRFGGSTTSNSSRSSARFDPRAPKFSLAKMNADRKTRGAAHPVMRPAAPMTRPAAPMTHPASLPVVRRDPSWQEDPAIARRAQEAEAEVAARASRVREEERRATLARLAKVPAKDRDRFLEEERLVARAREAVAADLKKREEKPALVGDLGSLFGIEMEDGAGVA